jgi:hypothetical protein
VGEKGVKWEAIPLVMTFWAGDVYMKIEGNEEMFIV